MILLKIESKLKLGKIKNVIHKIFNLLRYIKCVLKEGLIFDLKGIARRLHIPHFYNQYKNIEQLKNCEKGKRCFIIATGPSLRIEDLEQLKDEVTIAVNGIYRIFDQTDWRPTYYRVGDLSWFKRNLYNNLEIIESFCKKKAVINDTIRDNVASNKLGDKTIVVPMSFINNYMKFKKRFFRYSWNLLHGMYTGGTITNGSICLATYLGCKEIYLLGCDCDYMSKIKHIGIDGENIKDIIKDEEKETIPIKQQTGYQRVKEAVSKRNVKVYNATRGGKLEVFPRVNFDEIIGKKNEESN